MPAPLLCTSLACPERPFFGVRRRATRAWLAALAPAALAATLLPGVGHAAVTVLSTPNSIAKVQPNEIIKIKNDANLGLNFASTNRPPLRIRAARYRGVPLTTSGDLCVVMPNLGSDPPGQTPFGGVLELDLVDDEGLAAVTAVAVLDQGGGGNEAACRDPAPPRLAQSALSYNINEGATLAIPAADLVAAVRDPNGGTLTWVGTPTIQPGNAGTVSIQPVGSRNSISYVAATGFVGAATISYDVNDSDGDGPAAFQVNVAVAAIDDPPVVTSSNCSVGLTGGVCALNFTDPDTAPAALTVTIVQGPQFGALGTVNVANKQVTYTPRQGSTTPDTFTYTVSDARSTSAPPPATVSITVSGQASPPTATIRLLTTSGTPIANPASIADTNNAAGEPIRLDGTTSAPGNPSSPLTAYHWRINGTALAPTTSTVDVTLADGTSSIELIVDDQAGRQSAAATLAANVTSAPNLQSNARISIGGQLAVGTITIVNADFQPGETVTFDGSQSTDPEGDPFVEYAWTVNGTVVQRSASATASLALRDGANTVILAVRDSRGGTGSITITAEVTADADLGTISGLTSNERSMGTAISELCPRLNALPTLTAGQRDLLNRCTDILDDESVDQQRTAVQELTPEQITAQQTTGIDFSKSQMSNLTSRITALRRGGTGGLNVAGLSIRDENGQRIPLEQLAALVKHLTGGASGDEDKTAAADPANQSLAARWGIFVNGNVIDGDKDETANEAAYDFGGWGITAGFDYRFTDKLVLGLALGYNETSTDFASDGGGLDSEGVSTSVYGTYFNDRYYIDFIGTSGSLDYDSLRHIVYTDAGGSNDDRAVGTTSGDLTTLGVSFGYDFNKGGWSFGPTAALTNVEVEVDPFSETGAGVAGGMNLSFGRQDAQSRTAQGGFRVGYTASRKWGVLSPQFRIAFVKEFANDSEIVNVRFVNDPFTNNPNQPSPGAITILTDDPDDQYLRWGAGLSFVRGNGFSAFVDYEGLASLASISSGELTLGLRIERSFK